MLDDLSDLYPTLANSLKSLLDYPDEDVEDVSLKHWHNSNYILESLNLVRLKIVWLKSDSLGTLLLNTSISFVL